MLRSWLYEWKMKKKRDQNVYNRGNINILPTNVNETNALKKSTWIWKWLISLEFITIMGHDVIFYAFQFLSNILGFIFNLSFKDIWNWISAMTSVCSTRNVQSGDKTNKRCTKWCLRHLWANLASITICEFMLLTLFPLSFLSPFYLLKRL